MRISIWIFVFPGPGPTVQFFVSDFWWDKSKRLGTTHGCGSRHAGRDTSLLPPLPLPLFFARLLNQFIPPHLLTSLSLLARSRPQAETRKHRASWFVTVLSMTICDFTHTMFLTWCLIQYVWRDVFICDITHFKILCRGLWFVAWFVTS